MKEICIFLGEPFCGNRRARTYETPDRIRGGTFVAPNDYVVRPGWGGLIPDPDPWRLTFAVPSEWVTRETLDGGCALFAPGSREGISADDAFAMAVRGELGFSAPRRCGRA
jgi:hypothetical protein